MTSSTPELDDMIARINDLPDPGIRSIAMIGFARMLPQEEGEEVESERLPFLQSLACVEGELQLRHFAVDADTSLIVDPNEQLPRSDFYNLVNDGADIDDPSARRAAFTHIIDCILSKPGWIAW
jgi:hypothetical protein